MSPRRRNIIVGLIVLIGLGIVVWMVLLFAGRLARVFSSPGMTITLTSDRADGVSDGSAVYYRGIQVGQVTLVHLSSDNSGVVIPLSLKKGVVLPRNLRATIRTSSYFGTAADILLEPQGPPQGEMAADTTLKAEFEGSALIPKQFTALAEEARRRELLEHLDQTIVSIHEQADKAGKLVDSVQQLIGDKKMADDLRASVANIRLTTETATRATQNFEKFSSDANTTMSDVRVAIVKLSGTIEHFESIADKVDQGKGTAGLLVNDPKLYQGLVDTTAELHSTIADLKRVVDQWEQEGVTLRLNK